MKVLALDTTTRAGSAALLDDDRLVAERESDPSRTHAERLPAEIVTLVREQGVAIAEIDLFAVAVGPGSFTGLRVGIATMQGLALVRGRPLAGVSALDALAHAGSAGLDAGTRIAAWVDAHRRDVFAALQDVAQGAAFGSDRLIEIEAPTVGDPSATLARWRHLDRMPSVFIGDGAALYADAIAAAVSEARIIAPPPLAATIGRLALAQAHAGTTRGPAAVQPLYVRRPDAEIAREQARPLGTPGLTRS